jgi:hypothetical protein
VHSSKDLPTHLPSEIVIAGYLPREDARDAWISRGGLALDALPAGAVVGTASLRRAAQVKRRRPDLVTTLLRGNVETRLKKVENGEIDATLLALAGLKRLGLADRATALLSLEEFPPACGQGAIGLTRRAGDDATRDRSRCSSTKRPASRLPPNAPSLRARWVLAARRSPAARFTSRTVPSAKSQSRRREVHVRAGSRLAARSARRRQEILLGRRTASRLCVAFCAARLETPAHAEAAAGLRRVISQSGNPPPRRSSLRVSKMPSS